MDLTLFFVLPLIGGFAFVTRLSLLRYKTGREDAQRLYYRAALYGVLLAIAAALLHEIGQRASASYAAFMRDVVASTVLPLLEKERSTASLALSAPAQAIRVELAIICVWAFVLGALVPWNFALAGADAVWARIGPRRWRRSFLDRFNLGAITDPLEKLIAQSLFSASLIQVTLSNSKVYVGTVLESLDPGSPAKYFKIQPWMSGFRGEDGMVTFNTFYDEILADFEADIEHEAVVETFQLVIPIDKVLTASGFDVQAYERFLEERHAGDERDGEGAEPEAAADPLPPIQTR